MEEAKGRCPICGKEAAGKYKPFCSSRCASVDLGKWLGEGYRLKTDEIDEEKAVLADAKEGKDFEYMIEFRAT